MLTNPEEIFKRYLCGKILSVKELDTSHDPEDRRFVYIVDTDSDEHIVFKFSKNSFTSPKRIAAWKQLIDLYNKCGIYSPRILPDIYGCLWNKYLEGGEQYIVYAEEKKRYKTTDEFGLSGSDNSLYFEDMVKAAAAIAQCSTDLPDWKSAWCIYDTFCKEDKTDETYFWQDAFHRLVVQEMSAFHEQADRIWNRFLFMYSSFEPRHRALPQAFFQGDSGGLNVMLDDNRKFAGLLDFNLAGAEVILNYFFREFCRVRINSGDIHLLDHAAFLQAKDSEMRQRLDTVKKYYRFTHAERMAFPTYYNIVYPLECDLCQMFEQVIHQKDPCKVKLILDWIEYQQTRDSISL